MTDHQHYTDCHRHHFVCAQIRIHELQVKVQTLETQLQYERTGHLTPQVWGVDYGPGDRPSHIPRSLPVEIPPNRVTCGAIPCHDHIEPPIVSGGPTWAHRPDDPPSLTP